MAACISLLIWTSYCNGPVTKEVRLLLYSGTDDVYMGLAHHAVVYVEAHGPVGVHLH